MIVFKTLSSQKSSKNSNQNILKNYRHSQMNSRHLNLFKELNLLRYAEQFHLRSQIRNIKPTKDIENNLTNISYNLSSWLIRPSFTCSSIITPLKVREQMASNLKVLNIFIIIFVAKLVKSKSYNSIFSRTISTK